MPKFRTSLRELCTILFPFVFQSTSQKMWTKIVQVDNEIIITFFIYEHLCPKDLKEN